MTQCAALASGDAAGVVGDVSGGVSGVEGRVGFGWAIGMGGI